MVDTDVQRANAGDVTKINNHNHPTIFSIHAHLQFTLICFVDLISPVQWHLNFEPLLLKAWLMLISKELIQEMWKNQQSRCSDNFSASTLTFFVCFSVLLTEFPLFDGVDLFEPGLQRVNAEDLKNHQSWWSHNFLVSMLAFFALLSVLLTEFSLCDSIYHLNHCYWMPGWCRSTNN